MPKLSLVQTYTTGSRLVYIFRSVYTSQLVWKAGGNEIISPPLNPLKGDMCMLRVAKWMRWNYILSTCLGLREAECVTPPETSIARCLLYYCLRVIERIWHREEGTSIKGHKQDLYLQTGVYQRPHSDQVLPWSTCLCYSPISPSQTSPPHREFDASKSVEEDTVGSRSKTDAWLMSCWKISRGNVVISKLDPAVLLWLSNTSLSLELLKRFMRRKSLKECPRCCALHGKLDRSDISDVISPIHLGNH